MSAREFNQDVSAAKRAARAQPVVITDRGRPSHVLLSIDQYEKLVAAGPDIVDLLSVDDDLDLTSQPLDLTLRPVEL